VNFLIVLDKLGITAEMKPKLKTYEGDGMERALENGTEELGITGMAPMLEMKRRADPRRFPSEVQRWVQVGAGVSASSKEPAAARALLKFMMTAEAAAVAKTKGLER
jgi:molybdate transport system substrate-binding protein